MGSGSSAASPGPARGLDPAREGAILDAALGLLSEVGYDRMTVDEIARRARASKATIYRRWAGKPALAAAVLARLAVDHPPLPDTGSLRDDLRAALEILCRVAERKHSLLLGLMPAIRDDPELAPLLRQQLTKPATDEASMLLTRAHNRGELQCSPDADVLLELAEALVWRRLLVTGEPLDTAFVAHAVDRIVLPLIGGGAKR